MSYYSEPPFITIVMPVRNEERFIASTIEQLLKQDYPKNRFEIIVADGMSEDQTRKIVHEISEQHSNVRLLDNPGHLPSSGRNVGFKNGKGEVFMVVDGHCHIPTDQLLRNIVSSFEKSNAQCLGRPQPLNPPGLSEFQKTVAIARNSRIGHSGNSLIYSHYEGFVSPVSMGAIYKREIFEKIGYVDERFDACEDVEFNYRVEKAGFKTYMSPFLAIKYFPRETLKGLFKQMTRYGLGRFRFIRKHPDAINIEMFIPLGFVVGIFLFVLSGLSLLVSELGFGVSASDLMSVVFDLLCILYGLYVAIILTGSLYLSLKNGLHYFRLLPFIFFAIHFGLGWGFLVEMLKPSFRIISTKRTFA